MSTHNVSLEKLIANVDELYELAKLTECRINVPISHLRESFQRSAERSAGKIAAKFSSLTSRGKLDEALIIGAGLAVAWVGAGVVDLTRNAIANRKAKEALLPLYKEIAVKTQKIVSQVSQDNKRLTKLLMDEKQLNVNNQLEITALRKRIEKGEAIVQRFMALQTKH